MPAAASPADQKSVLILLPGQPGLPVSVAIAEGIRSQLVSAWSTRITIETEHVDVARFVGTEHEETLRDLYRTKYAGRPFDAIVVAMNEPLGFVLRSRDRLWPRIPVIACAAGEDTLKGFAVPPDFTVIPVRYDMEGTLGAALRLLPATRHVALVGGASPQDRVFHGLARQAVGAFGDRLDVIDLIGLPIEEVLARVAALPEQTIVLGSAFQVDGAGRRFFGVDLVGPVSAASNRPLFTVFGTTIGLGIVGGSLTDFEAVGREAGEMALRVLGGAPKAAGSARSSAAFNALVFDWRQLQRWGLDEGRLPPGSRVLYRPPTLWEQYKSLVVSAVLVVVAQAALIIGLLAERRRRRRAQVELAERLGFEALVADISAAFASLSASRVDEQIQECLRRIVVFLGLDRATLWQLSPDRQTLSATHSWTAEGRDPAPTSMAADAFPLLRALAESASGLRLASPDDLPSGTGDEREALDRQGVRSLAAVALRIGKRSLGFLTLVNFTGARSWPDQLMHRLRTLAELLANALMRKQAAAALQTSEAVNSALLSGLAGEAAILDGTGAIVQTNEAWAAAARTGGADGLSPAPPGANYLDACRAGAASDESIRNVLDLIEAVLQGRRAEGVLDYQWARPGGDRWFEVRVQHLDRPGGGAAIMRTEVTDRKKAEAAAQRHLSEIAHLNRVAAMGELAASLAHELNQPLTAILSNAQAATQLLAGADPDVPEARECLAGIVRSDRLAGEVIQRMRSLLRKKEGVERRPVSLNELARNIIALVANDALLHRVSIDLALVPVQLGVSVDPVQIQQVILNLLVNAISAAAIAPAEPRVTVRTAAGEGWVELEVRDSGKGIAESDLERVFEPFFTTKDQGLGMGLAISRSIIDAHGGRIWAESDPAGGATFRFRLPAP